MARVEYFLLCYILARAVSFEQSASFYGESYVSVPLEEAGSSTDLILQFLTHRPHGLLLLAAGPTDHLLLEVKAGRLHVAIDLGSGEATLHSSASVRLDDQQWHEVRVNRSGDTLALSVDGVDQGSVHTPGSFHELNIRDGVFLGGRGTYDSEKHANRHSYRGCLKGVLFNGMDVLTAARDLKSVQNAFEISWDCDSEFSARSDAPVSLLSDTSFVAFSRFHVRERGSLACDIKTRAENAVVLFNTGTGDYKDDFLALEIVGGTTKLSLNAGGGVVEVVGEGVVVSDGRWHELDLSVSRSSIGLRVDGEQNTTRFFHTNGQRSHLNLAGHLFIGGLGLRARSHALRLGLRALQGDRAMRGSMVGCVRNVVINARPYGFREMQVSRHVDPQCSWTFPCAADPCVEGAECVETGDAFRCACDQPVCEREEERDGNGLPGAEEDVGEMVAVVPLEVREGGEAVITTNTIDVIFDYRSRRIREIALQFRVVLPPRFGHLQVDRGQRQAESFTLHDLLTAKVKYIHDGTDSRTDDITMEMSVGSGSDLPAKLRGNFEFVLPIKVTPHHDPPKLRLPSGNQISVLENSKLQLTTAVVDVRDPDSKSQDLKYSVHFLRPARSFFHDYAQAERATTTFSHQDLTDSRVWFNAHEEDAVVDVRLNVTDQTGLRDSVLLRFLMVALKVRVERNTGLLVPYSSSALFHPGNLSAVTNVPLQNLDVRYRVTKLPRLGQIQRLQGTGVEEWTDVDTFTQRHLNASRLRYRHFSADFSLPADQFSFIASANDLETEEQVFRIKLRPASLTVTHSNRLVVHQVPYAQLTNSSLLVSPEFGQIDTSKLTFSLFRTPKQGDLYLAANNRIFNPLDFDSLKPIEKGGNFSQADVDLGRLYFKFDSPGFDRVEDYVDLTIKYPSSGGRMMRLWVEYVPLDSAIRFTNNGLREVPEGGQKAITRSSLYLEMDEYKQFQFSLIQPPRHGNISLYDTRTSSIVEPSVGEFSSADIREGRVLYCHDDSENDRDSFVFAAIPLFSSEREMPEEIQEFTGTFHMAMAMRNDNPPRRVVDKVLEVVTHGRKKLTIQDLAFTDPDVHYNASGLQYRRQAMNNGEILLVSTNTPVYQFTQADLESQRLIFQHKGPAGMGHASLFVSDGQFYWTGLLEVRASDPYVRLGNNTGLTVLRGREAALSPGNLTLDTNMDFPPASFSFIVTQEPNHGTLTMEGDDCSEFTYADVVQGRVLYTHDGSDSEEDWFRFTVIHGDVQSEGEVFPIMIEDANMKHPPQIVHNTVLTIDQGQTAAITDSHLLAQHPSLNAEEVVFIVTQAPEHGFLQLRGAPFSPDDPIQFSQGEISRGLVEYVQTQESAVVDDSFIFDVDSDSRVLKHLVFSIEVIPSSLPVQPGSLSVDEGGSVALTADDTLKTLGSKYQSENLIYEIITIPAHGHIINTDRPTQFNEAFSSDTLALGKIVYQHDDSESLNDSFAIIAATSDGSLKSQPLRVEITIVARDDQAPRVVVNKALSVWADSVTLLTGDHLHAEDPDTSSDNIVFTVRKEGVGLTNGHLAFLNNTFVSITRFTQRDVDAGRVAFVHQGESQGQFQFQASDGTSSDVVRTFRVEAHPVVLQLRRKGPVLAFPNTIQPVSNRSLLALTAAPNFSKPIVFTMVQPKPQHGQMVTMVGGRPVAIQSFTQGEINEGRVFYQHLSYMEQWTQTDVLHLEVSTAYAAPLTGARCEVHVSFANIYAENQAMLLGLYEPSVEEGGSLPITRHHFDSTQLHKRLTTYSPEITLTFRITTPPTHGHLQLNGVKVMEGTTFTQEDIDAERMCYDHDDSDTLVDSFSFVVEMLGTSGEVWGGEEEEGVGGSASGGRPLNFTIEVKPVNDQSFRLVTPNPSLRVLQGGRAVLTPDILQTVDPDTAPGDLVYTVLSQPSSGKLVRANDSAPHAPGETFTQRDVDQSLLLFAHNGTRTGGSVNLMVTDGHFPPEYTILNVVVVPVVIDMSGIKPVPLTQSESSVRLSGEFLNVTTNGAREAIHYQLTGKPGYGQILVRGREAQLFSQTDVDSGTLTYLMLNFSASQDTFACRLHMENLDVQVERQEFRVVVKPLVTHAPLTAPPGATVAITKFNLDASELGRRTGDIPVFEIVSPPARGRILRKLRKRRDLIAQPVLKPVERFTFEDVEYAKIYYISNASSEDGAPIHDRFSYVLTANNAQPAMGQFLINMKEGEEGMLDESDTSQGSSDGDDDNDDGLEVVGVRGDEDEGDSSAAMIVGVVLGVLLVLVVVGVVVFVLWRRQQGGEKVKYRDNSRARPPRPYISGPLQLLEQPHVLIEPQSTDDALTPSSPDPTEGEEEGGGGEERRLVPHPSSSPSYHAHHHHHLPHINFTHHDPSPSSNTPLLSSPPSSTAHHPRSPDISRTEVSSAVPDCKVTPLVEVRGGEAAGVQPATSPGSGGDRQSGRSSTGGGDLYDWTLMDPELLQHCRTETPVLKGSQYWV